jgi:hypothetical protein
MKDRSLGIWLMVFFGVSGLAVTILAWSLPTLAQDRIGATIFGLAGIGVALVRGLMLRKGPAAPAEAVSVKATSETEE